MKSSCLTNSPALSKLTYHVTYYPAVLKKYGCNHGWVIEYSVLNPTTEKMVKFTKKMNSIRKRFSNYYAFRDYAMTLVNDINRRLSAGWSPIEYVPTGSAEAIIMQTYGNKETQRVAPMLPIQHAAPVETVESIVAVTTEILPVATESASPTAISTTPPVVKDKIKDVIALFIKDKTKDLRPDTMRSYKSSCNTLQEYLDVKEMSDMYIQDFTVKDARRYLGYLTETKELRNVTYNNYLKTTRCFFQWAVEQCYIETNPLAGIKTKQKEEKIRTLVDPDSRRRIMAYLEERGETGFQLVCQLVFMSLIRPKEISMLRIQDIDMDKKCIHIKSHVAKTHYSRTCAVSDEVIALLNKLHLEQYPKDYYLIGKGMMPSNEEISLPRFRKRWSVLRDDLGLPKEMQLYSLKDTGITEMLQANIPVITVRDHAGHHDLRITERYAHHQEDVVIEQIREAAPKF